MIKLSTLKLLDNNPRGITDAEMERLKNSITDFEKMMRDHKITVDENNLVLAGNQRVKALKKLGYNEIPEDWIHRITDYTEDEKKKFIVRHNDLNGFWLHEILVRDYPGLYDKVDTSFADEVTNEFMNEPEEDSDVPEMETNAKTEKENVDYFVTVQCESKEQAESLLAELKVNYVAIIHQ